MTVITISRQFGSGGDEIADRLCELLGYHHFDKRMIVQAAAEAGLSEQEVIDYSEENHKVQTFMDRILGRSAAVAEVMVWREDAYGVRIPEKLTLNENTALELVQKAIQAAYTAGNMVIIGRGGQVLLKDKPDAVHVRIEAPTEDRVQRLKVNMKQDLQAYQADIEVRRAAQDLILKHDEVSADYIKRFYNADINDPMLYHLMINTGKVGLEQAAWIIAEMARSMQKEPVSA